MQKLGHSGIKLSQLRALIAVADCSNFSEAAWQLGLTQPTVSHAIANLEAELGVILLIRGRQGAKLTPAGEEILTHSRKVLQSLSLMQQSANRHKGLQGGQVRVATFRSAAAQLLPETVAAFGRNLPNISVTITEHYDTPYVEQALRAGTADVGVTILPAADDLETWTSFEDDYLVLLSPNSDWSEPQVDWAFLTTTPLILYPDDNSCFRSVNDYFQTAGYHLKPRYQFRETSTILNMVAQGLGAAIVPRLSAHTVPPEVKLAELPSPLTRQVGVTVLADSLHTPAVFAFLDTLRQAIAETRVNPIA
ncbi:MAG: LysR family transcriptional regulator [Cyanobacteria bacterium J06635_15]